MSLERRGREVAAEAVDAKVPVFVVGVGTLAGGRMPALIGRRTKEADPETPLISRLDRAGLQRIAASAAASTSSSIATAIATSPTPSSTPPSAGPVARRHGASRRSLLAVPGDGRSAPSPGCCSCASARSCGSSWPEVRWSWCGCRASSTGNPASRFDGHRRFCGKSPGRGPPRTPV